MMIHFLMHYSVTTLIARALQVPTIHIQRLDLVPDIDQGVLKINILGSPAAAGAVAQVSIA